MATGVEVFQETCGVAKGNGEVTGGEAARWRCEVAIEN